MRFFAPLVAVLAAVASAQSGSNAISIPNGGLVISAGSSTITWTNPSSGTLTIKLQKYPGTTTPTDGIVVASNVQASSLSAVITVPADAVVPNQRYVLETIDDSGAVQPNYSNDFTVSGATGTATASGSSSGTMTATDTITTITGTSSSSSVSVTETGSTNTRSTSTRTNTSSSASNSPTSAPNSTGGAGKLAGAQGGLFAFMVAVVAIL